MDSFLFSEALSAGETLNNDETLLSTIANNMRIRAEVEKTVQSLLTDVELAYSLETALHWEDERSHLTRKAMVYKMVCEETKMVQEEETRKASEMADLLVKDMYQVSQELGQLRRWKKTEIEEREIDRQKWEEKLKDAEEQIMMLLDHQDKQQEKKQKNQYSKPPTTDNIVDTPEGGAKPSSSSDPQTIPSKNETIQYTSSETVKLENDKNIENKATLNTTVQNNKYVENDTRQLKHKKDSANAMLFTSQSKNATIDITTSSTIAPATLMIDDDEPQLETFEEIILLHVFAYMDALEIVQLAQVNIALYSRVDSLFGISDQPSNTLPPPPTEIKTTTMLVPQQETATVVSLPPETTITKTTITKSPPPEAKKPVSNTSGGIISLFQAGKPREQLPVPLTSTATYSPALTNDSVNKAPLSAAMANSMADKLTDKEINAIISMTEKLNRRNKEVDALSKENSTLRGELDGIGAIKAFLVQKVRELEGSFSQNQEVEIKTAQQIASDQEVIAFLDSRVQELEQRERILEIQAKKATEDLVRTKVQSDSKISVLSDMLRYERERQAENEGDWKTTKKVLVKEIKLCRAQIMALQAEKNGLKEQVEQLQKAVLPIGVGGVISTGIVLSSPLTTRSKKV
mmetsp:Transcript_22967/g.26195  ORF Transcript_22967/g.26195 Transcript_22967/m.26195 type:complete len:633 (-) Transcript_22967:238-2136(-)